MDGKEYYQKLLDYTVQIKDMMDFVPDVAMTLGSGLGEFANQIKVVKTIPYSDLPGFPVSTAPGHVGEFVFGTLNGVKVGCMRGRIHYYEGREMSEVVMPMRVLHMLGAKTAVITNSVGCMNKKFSIGSFMVHKDCITSFVPSPLRGANIDELGPRFLDLTNLYDKDLRKKVLEIGKAHDIEVHKGVLIQVSGPQFETSTEIKAYKKMGADCVGMSSAVEAVAAHHMNMRVCGISCITNYSTGISKDKLSGEEVLEVANRVSKNFSTLVTELITSLKED